MTQPTQAAAAVALEADAVPETEVLRLLAARGSVRSYRPDPVPEAWVEAILAAGQRAPTSSNLQACSIVVVRDPRSKARLAELAGNQRHIVDCPVFFALCADLHRPAYACELHGMSLEDRTLEKGLVASIDAALVGMSMTLAADSMGLGTVMIGGMRNRPLEVAELLGLPPRVYVVFGLCLGWPKAAPQPKPRLPLAAIVHRETYDASGLEDAVAGYDAELARHYTAQGRSTPEHAWSRVIAEKFSQPNRARLREELRTLGFPLE